MAFWIFDFPAYKPRSVFLLQLTTERDRISGPGKLTITTGSLVNYECRKTRKTKRRTSESPNAVRCRIVAFPPGGPIHHEVDVKNSLKFAEKSRVSWTAVQKKTIEKKKGKTKTPVFADVRKLRETVSRRAIRKCTAIKPRLILNRCKRGYYTESRTNWLGFRFHVIWLIFF